MQIELKKSRSGIEMSTTIEFRAIHRKVLLIAATRADDTWKAYVHPVDGNSHQKEALQAYEDADGVPLLENQARAFFVSRPFSDMEYAR
jgi:hypothetical protein